MTKNKSQKMAWKNGNYKIKIIPLENIKLGEFYTFSLNMSDQYDSLEQSIMAYKYFLKKYCSDLSKFELYFEISPTGRLHMHGIIVFESNIAIVKWYHNNNIIKNIASYEIDTIDNMETWQIYCKKQQHILMDEPLLHKINNETIKSAKPVHLRDIITESFEEDETVTEIK